MDFDPNSYIHDDGFGLDKFTPQQNSARHLRKPPYPAPAAPLESSYQPQSAKQSFAGGKPNPHPLPLQRLSIDRPYLRSPKYLDYRERKRQDIGKDGKPVWPDHVEASFQNALVWIPPMGRKKRPQNGKPHGRNELIAEWIFQETGEVRDRKQVSSHIQVLGNLLKHVPEWQALTKVDDNADEEYKEAMAQHSNSIADIIQHSRRLRAQNEYLLYGRGWQGSSTSLTRLRFDMWLARPETFHDALHTYSRIQRDRVDSPEIPLESFKGWRQSFPGLEQLIQVSPSQEYDLIWLKCNIDLMSDDLPPDSKMGLMLNLDFRQGRGNIPQAMDDMFFSCTNTFYHHGQTFMRKHHARCNPSERGVIKPPFEVRWWVNQLVTLTRKFESTNHAVGDAAVALAKDSSRAFLHNLTVLQVVEGSSNVGGPSSQVPVTKPIAVLLWTFSQASDKRAAVTKWQRLIPPPRRDTTNSPLTPSHEMGPSLNLNSRLQNTYQAGRSSNTFDRAISAARPSAYPTMIYPEPAPAQDLFFSNTNLTTTEKPFLDSSSEVCNFDDTWYPDQVIHNSDLTSFQYPYYNSVAFEDSHDQTPAAEAPNFDDDPALEFGLQ